MEGMQLLTQLSRSELSSRPHCDRAFHVIVLCRTRPRSAFLGNTRLDTAGRWIKMPFCSRSGPCIQVSVLYTHTHTHSKEIAHIYKQMRKYVSVCEPNSNAFCRKIRSRPVCRPKDVESQLPLCHELAAWHWGSKTQERQQRPPSSASLQATACPHEN